MTATLVLRPLDVATELPAVAELVSDTNELDGAEWFLTAADLANEWRPSPMFDPSRNLQCAEVDGHLVGIVSVSWRERPGVVVHRIEPKVHPAHRNRGIGTALLQWGGDRARASVVDGSGGRRDLDHAFSSFAFDSNPAAVRFAAKHGYEPFRYHFLMRRDLDEAIPDVPLPEGFEIRPVSPEHHRAIWLADVEAFQDHWDASVPHEEDFVQFFAEPDIDTSLWQVAWAGDEVAGMVINTIHAHENARTGLAIGWLDGVSTRRQWRGRGLAGALIARSLRLLRDRGLTLASLGVDTENPSGALGLYERFGFHRHQVLNFYRKPF